MCGEAVFTPEMPAALAWREAAVMRLGAYKGAATQHYRIDGLAGGAGTLRFADGRLFARLDLTGGACTIVHDCAPDRYEGAFRLYHADHWGLCWRIAGPRKDQTIRTAFRRLKKTD